MHLLFGTESFEAVLGVFSDWMFNYIISLSALYQMIATAVAFVIAYFLSKPMRKFLQEHHLVKPQHELIKESITTLVVAMSWVLVQAIIVGLSVEMGFNTHITRTILSLLLVWVFARFVSSFVKDALLSKVLAISAWSIAALHIVGLLEPTEAVLSQIGLRVGDIKLSLLDLLWGVVVLLLLLWAANSASSQLESRINQRSDLEPSVKVLFSKLLRAFLVGVALLFAVSAVGIDVSAFTVLGGAIGLGIGFGLQKVVSNLICGVILLMDRSIKPGDVICVKDGKTYGTVNQLSARFVAVRTPAGEEHLIPNEEIITRNVENWSYSDRNIRISLPIRIALDSDVRKAMQVLLDSANGVRRVLPFPKSAVRLKNFGEWAIELELLVWINDPENGLSSVKSDLYLSMWDAFRREGIVIPVPQRDVHLSHTPVELLEPAGA